MTKEYFRIRLVHNKWWVLRYRVVDDKSTDHPNGHLGPFSTIDIAKKSADALPKKFKELDRDEKIKSSVPYGES